MIRSLACALLAAAAVHWFAPRIRELPTDAPADDFHLPPRALQAASAGYQSVLADWYWIDAIHYYGVLANYADHYRRLPGYLEIASDLDPEFDYLYQFAAFTVPEHDRATGLWYNTGAAIRLAEKGMRSHSKRWQIPFGLGYLLFTFRGDYADAGRYMEEASKRPRAPNYVASLATRLLAQGGSIETAIAFASAALRRTVDQRTHDELEDRLRALHLQRDLTMLNEAAREVAARGAPPQNLDDLIGHAGIAAIPADPFGGQFVLSEGRVSSRHADRLLHLYIYPGHAPIERSAD